MDALTIRDGEAPSMRQQAYERLRRMIVTCTLEPGRVVSELELRTLSGQARTPTREAAVQLLGDKLLLAVPRQGFRVAPITLASAERLLDVSDLLLVEVSRSARSVDESAHRALRDLVAHPPREHGAGTLDRMLDVSERLVRSFIARCDNPWLVSVFEPLQFHVLRLWTFAWEYSPMSDLIGRGYRPLLEFLELSGTQPEKALSTLVTAQAWIRHSTLEGLAARLRDSETTY